MDAVKARRSLSSSSAGLLAAAAAAGGGGGAGAAPPTAAGVAAQHHQTPKQQARSSSSGGAAAANTITSSSTTTTRKEAAWVGVRIRPLLERELLAREQVGWKAAGRSTLQQLDAQRPPGQAAPTYQYARVFPENASCEAVYADAARGPLAAAVLHGRHATIMAYGPTGSGKTHTIAGLLRGAAADVFRLIASEGGAREYVVRLSALEVYNEVVRDLLQERTPSLKLTDDAASAARGGGAVADGASEAGVGSEAALQQLLADVAARRQTRATRMNDNSSRSHAIVRLLIESRALPIASGTCTPHDSQQGLSGAAAAATPSPGGSAARRARSSAVTAAVVMFVDLAGSERAADMGEQQHDKLRQKEAANLHKSLQTLNAIIRGLADNQRHLPYRDSKLTRLLQPYLGGNSHLSVIATMSPAAGASDATRAALQFASAASRITVRPQRNTVSGSRAAIRGAALEIQQLKARLAQQEDGGAAAARQPRDALAAVSEQERSALRAKLHQLQDQILRGNAAPVPAHKLRASLDSSQEPLWRNRVAVAKELRASSAGILSLRAAGDAAAARDSHGHSTRYQQQPAGASSSGGGSNASSSAAARPPLDGDSSPLLAGVSEVRRSMRLLNCYLPRNSDEVGGSSSSGAGNSRQPLPNQQQPQQQQQGPQLQQQAGFQSILQQAAARQQQPQGSKQQGILARRQQQHQQQQHQQQTQSLLAPASKQQQQHEQPQSEDVLRAMQMQKLQEPCGPEAEAAMAGLEVEVRCYKHVQEYTLAELSAALEHLESQAAAGQGTGSWSHEQLDALRSEVARKRAAQALTQLGDRALDALARKVNSYTSSADNSPFCDAATRAQARPGSTSGGGVPGCSRDASSLLEVPEALMSEEGSVAAAASARPSSAGGDAASSRRTSSSPEAAYRAAGDAGSWPEVSGACLASGKATPPAAAAAPMPAAARRRSSKPGSRPASAGGAATPAAPLTPALLAAEPVPAAAAAAQPDDHQPMAAEEEDDLAALSAEPSSSAGAASSGASSRRLSCAGSAATAAATDTTGVTSGLLSPVSSTSEAAALSAQAQLARMQEAWRESVEKDVTCLREVLGQYKEQAERLEMQKKLLLSQVLKLEFCLEEEEGQRAAMRAANAGLQAQLAQALRQRDAVLAAAAAAAGGGAAAGAPGSTAAGDAGGGGGGSTSAAAAAGGVMPPAGGLNISLPPLPGGPPLACFDGVSDDGWASSPTVESLLPKIVALWDELYVPLAYRSRFYLCFRGREVFYYEVEARRLEWKRSQMLAGTLDEPAGGPGGGGGSTWGDHTPRTAAPPRPGGTTPRPLSAAVAAGLTASASSLSGMRRRSKELDRAARALDWERKSLAAGLKWNLTEAEREELFRAWGVDADTKERKLQLVFKLWSRETLQQPDGMQRSSELVVMLCGMDASEHMMELVFGSHLREYGGAATSLGRNSSTGLSMALGNVVRRLAPPLSRAGAIGGSPLRSSLASANGYGGGGFAGSGFPPPRAAGSFTSRLNSGFMSLLGSKERPLGGGGLSSQHLAGMGGGGGPASREGSFSSLASSVIPSRRH